MILSGWLSEHLEFKLFPLYWLFDYLNTWNSSYFHENDWLIAWTPRIQVISMILTGWLSKHLEFKLFLSSMNYYCLFDCLEIKLLFPWFIDWLSERQVSWLIDCQAAQAQQQQAEPVRIAHEHAQYQQQQQPLQQQQQIRTASPPHHLQAQVKQELEI